MRWMRRGTAAFAVLTAALYAVACGPDSQNPVDPMDAPIVASAPADYNPVSGAAFTTYNPWVDGDTREICKNSIINCNIYGAKEYVWLNGGPAANGLTDGEYFFAVLVPGGQPNPNDDAPKNLSDEQYGDYHTRTFIVSGGEVSGLGPLFNHDSDDGPFEDPDRKVCKSPKGCDTVDDGGDGPLLRLFPYDDTTNPGGVYILAICTLENGYPVRPRDCKYDAFKVKEGKVTYDFKLFGYKFEDLNGDGAWNGAEVGLEGWEITIKGTGFLGETIDEVRITDADGYWEYQSVEYSFKGSDQPETAYLTVCEVQQLSWIQTAPASGCYDVVIEPSGTYVPENPLNFGNYIPEGCTPGFWQGGPDKPDAKAGGALLWDGVDFVPPLDNPVVDDLDLQWPASGGATPPGNPYIHSTRFHDVFTGTVAGNLTMFDLVDTGGGSEAWRKAARSLVAAYLNTSWGMTYPFTTDQLEFEWASRQGNDTALLALHAELDAANNAQYRDETAVPRCPISASGW